MFRGFICANDIGNLLNNLVGVKIFNPVPVIFLFSGFNVTLSAVVSSGSIYTFSSSFSGGIGGK